MISPLVLSSSDRHFFRNAHIATKANPFGDRRQEADEALGCHLKTDENVPSIVAAILAVVKRVQKLEQKRRANLAHYRGEDRKILKSAFLFDVFHRYLNDFDKLIQDQQLKPGKSLPVDFARDAIVDFEKRGFAPHEAERYFALCYQMRRAFYFIRLGLVGRSPSMKTLRKSLWNNVFTNDIELYDQYLWNRMEDFSTLLLGETGTGKGSAAMAIGQSSFIPFDRQQGRFQESFASIFISLNLSQHAEALIESELFGHTKGAFTGAVRDHQGVLTRCSPHGAIFLDEVGEVPHSLQIKLLRVLEERLFSPVGSHKTHRFAGRVIAATNRSAESLLDNGIMREDFFYRLCSDLIVVPPLRRRIREDPEELDDIVTAVATRIIGKPSPDLVAMVLRVIDRSLGRDYPWPGNVRELAQCVRRILLNQTYEQPARGGGVEIHPAFVQAMADGRVSAVDLQAGYCHYLFEMLGTYGAVARRTGLDRRTVKKYVGAWAHRAEGLPDTPGR